MALIFLLFGAPDLSFTQFMVETLSVVIIALVMNHLSLLSATSARACRCLVIRWSLSPSGQASAFADVGYARRF